jgi:hypothetical protein
MTFLMLGRLSVSRLWVAAKVMSSSTTNTALHC